MLGFFFLKRTFYFRKNYNYSSEDSFVSGCHCYNLICFFQVQYVVIRRNEAGCYNKQVNGSILLFLAFNPYMIYRRVCILTYILHNANFDCLIEVRTKIPLLEEAIERERVFHNSISIWFFYKGYAVTDTAFTFHELNSTILSTFNHHILSQKYLKDGWTSNVQF